MYALGGGISLRIGLWHREMKRRGDFEIVPGYLIWYDFYFHGA